MELSNVCADSELLPNFRSSAARRVQARREGLRRRACRLAAFRDLWIRFKRRLFLTIDRDASRSQRVIEHRRLSTPRRRGCAEPSQRASRMDWLESIMAIMGRSVNERRCNTVELSVACGVARDDRKTPVVAAMHYRKRSDSFQCRPGAGEARLEGGNGEQQSEVARCGADTPENARADDQASRSSAYLGASVSRAPACIQQLEALVRDRIPPPPRALDGSMPDWQC